MLELAVVIIAVMTVIFFYFGWPVIRHYSRYKAEREALEKRYNRLWRSRREMLVSLLFRQYAVLEIQEVCSEV